MKLPLMATLTALLLGGCANQAASRTADTPDGTGGSGSGNTEAPAGERNPFSSDEFSWDVEESPRTQAMLRAHGMNPYGDAGARAAAEAENAGTGGSGAAGQASTNPDDYECVDIDTLGTGGSGSIDLRAVDNLAPSPAPSQNPGARLDITPPAWNRNKGIGMSPVAPTTGTPPVEGSGGASGR